MQLSATEENYLKAILTLSERNKNFETSTNKISDRIKTKPPTVTIMLRNLKEKELISYEKYKRVQLTSEGKKRAFQIVRKHRLWEVFLYDKLKFTWDEVHEIAEQLEHTVSDKLTDRLDEFLGFPSLDPHGDPIPDRNGKIKKLKTQPLALAPVKKKLTVVSIINSSNEFLKYLDRVGIKIGDSLVISEVEEFDKSVTIQHKKNTIVLSKAAVENLLVAV